MGWGGRGYISENVLYPKILSIIIINFELSSKFDFINTTDWPEKKNSVDPAQTATKEQ